MMKLSFRDTRINRIAPITKARKMESVITFRNRPFSQHNALEVSHSIDLKIKQGYRCREQICSMMHSSIYKSVAGIKRKH
jgi:hypothetical protein